MFSYPELADFLNQRDNVRAQLLIIYSTGDGADMRGFVKSLTAGAVILVCPPATPPARVRIAINTAYAILGQEPPVGRYFAEQLFSDGTTRHYHRQTAGMAVISEAAPGDLGYPLSLDMVHCFSEHPAFDRETCDVCTSPVSGGAIPLVQCQNCQFLICSECADHPSVAQPSRTKCLNKTCCKWVGAMIGQGGGLPDTGRRFLTVGPAIQEFRQANPKDDILILYNDTDPVVAAAVKKAVDDGAAGPNIVHHANVPNWWTTSVVPISALTPEMLSDMYFTHLFCVDVPAPLASSLSSMSCSVHTHMLHTSRAVRGMSDQRLQWEFGAAGADVRKFAEQLRAVEEKGVVRTVETQLSPPGWAPTQLKDLVTQNLLWYNGYTVIT